MDDIGIDCAAVVRARVVGIRGNITSIACEDLSGEWLTARTLDEWRVFCRTLKRAFPFSWRRLPPKPTRARSMSWSYRSWFESRERWAARLMAVLSLYLRQLLSLPPFISQTHIVVRFLLPCAVDHLLGTAGCDQSGRCLEVRCRPTDASFDVPYAPGTSRDCISERIRRTAGLPVQQLFCRDPESRELIPIRDTDDLHAAVRIHQRNPTLVADLEAARA